MTLLSNMASQGVDVLKQLVADKTSVFFGLLMTSVVLLDEVFPVPDFLSTFRTADVAMSSPHLAPL